METGNQTLISPIPPLRSLTILQGVQPPRNSHRTAASLLGCRRCTRSGDVCGACHTAQARCGHRSRRCSRWWPLSRGGSIGRELRDPLDPPIAHSSPTGHEGRRPPAAGLRRPTAAAPSWHPPPTRSPETRPWQPSLRSRTSGRFPARTPAPSLRATVRWPRSRRGVRQGRAGAATTQCALEPTERHGRQSHARLRAGPRP